jgi:DNA-binding NarL/FixJ family response regulator
MIVDDHAVLREGLRFMLRNETDIEIVEEAANGREALELLESTDVDVLMLDVKMPEMDGLTTLEHVSESYPQIPFLVLTTYDDPGYVESAIRSGASGYLLKTASAEEIIRAIQAAHRGDGYLQPEITPLVFRRFAAQAAQNVMDIDLSPREQDVLQLISDGKSTKQIASTLHLSESTVKTHLRSMFDKLGATHRAHAVALALRYHLID